MFTKSILSGTVATLFCVASFANAAMISQTVDVTSTSPYGLFSSTGTPGVSSITGITHNVPGTGVTLVYDLNLAIDWIDSTGASSTAGFTGNVTYFPGNAMTTVPLGFDTFDTSGVDEEQLDIDGFTFTANGVTTDIYEEVTFTVSNLVVMGGTASFTGFSGYLTGNNPATGSATGPPAAGVTQNFGPGSLSLSALGQDVTGNADNSDFRLRNLVLDFEVTAVPEPNSAMLLGLLGVFMAGRRWKRCLAA